MLELARSAGPTVTPTLAAAGHKVFVLPPEAGVDGVEALRHALVLPHQDTVLQVPQVHALKSNGATGEPLVPLEGSGVGAGARRLT